MGDKAALPRKAIAVVLWVVASVVLAVIVVLVFVPADNGLDEAPGDVRFSFGYSRADLTRTSTINLCQTTNDWHADRFPECPQYDRAAAGAGTRPAVTGASVARDLGVRNPDGAAGSCDPKDTGPQFPAVQITVTASNAGEHDIAYVAVATPLSPEEVIPGTYCGAILITRAPVAGASNIENPIVLPVSVELADRTQPPIIARVGVALLAGALLGGIIKWIADNLGAVAAARRRYQRLLATGLNSIDNLPQQVRLAASALKEAISQSNMVAIAEATRDLEAYDTKLGVLGQWAYVSEELKDNVGEQDSLLDRWGSRPGQAKVRAARDLIADGERQRYSTSPADLTAESVGLPLAMAAQSLTRLMRSYLVDPTMQDTALDPAITLVKEAFAGPDSQLSRKPALERREGTGQPGSPMKTAKTQPHDHRLALNQEGTKPGGVVMTWAVKHSTFLILSLAALVAAVFGLSSQYLNDPTFTDSFTDYFTLFLWAFVGVLAGGSLADIITRLNSATPTPPRTSSQ